MAGNTIIHLQILINSLFQRKESTVPEWSQVLGALTHLMLQLFCLQRPNKNSYGN